MKININYLNDEFAIEFDEEITAGRLVAHLINYLKIPVPVLNFYKNKIALQLWSELEEIMIIKVENQYSKFRDLLRKGPDAYIELIIQKHLEQFIMDHFIENDFEKLKTNFDLVGLFTRDLIKANYFVDDKSCD
jgi:hypothetical protein